MSNLSVVNTRGDYCCHWCVNHDNTEYLCRKNYKIEDDKRVNFEGATCPDYLIEDIASTFAELLGVEMSNKIDKEVYETLKQWNDSCKIYKYNSKI